MSCTPSPDTATKKRRVSFCCSDDPPDKWLNTPTVPVTGLDGLQYNVLADMQPWEYCGFGSTGGCGRPNNWHDFCGQAFDPTGYDPANPPAAGASIPCGTGGGPSVMGTNNFTLNPAYKAIKHCQHPGWKGVSAMPPYPGREGFLYGTACCPTDTVQYKYRTVDSEFSASYSYEGHYTTTDSTAIQSDVSGTRFFSAKVNSSVDAYGNKSGKAVEHSGSSGSCITSQTIGTDRYKSTVNVDIQDECGIDGWNAELHSGEAYPENTFDSYGPQIDFVPLNYFFWLPSLLDAQCHRILIDWYYPGNPVHEFNGTEGELNAQNYFAPSDGFAPYSDESDSLYRTQTWRTVADIVPLHADLMTDNVVSVLAKGTATIRRLVTRISDGSTVSDGTKTISWQWKYKVTLSDPITFQSVQDDGKALQATWNIGDPEVHPWRTDGSVWLLPFVTRDALSTGPDVNPVPCPEDLVLTSTRTGADTTDDVSTLSGSRAATPREFSESRYTGAIIGAPQEVGKARYFNFNQKVNCAVCASGLVIQDNNWFCISGWGQLSYDPLPKTATQWTDPELGSLLRKGASVVQYGGSVVMTKWAETLMPWPSVNIARPFGRDRFLIDYADSGLTDDPACSGGAGVAIATYEAFGDICTDNTSFLYAHRKFPTCRPIGSTIGISAAADNGDGTVTLTTAEQHWLCGAGDGHGYTDAIDFYNVPGLGAGVVVETATPGSTTFIVSGSLTSAYTGGGYIASAGMTADIAKWDYTCPRHQFLVQTWDVNKRAYGASPGYQYSETQATLTPKSGFSVLLCSPNNDTFPDDNAVYRAPWKDITNELCGLYYFSAAIGNMWICNFVQAVADPFFIMPTKCAADGDTRHFASGPFCSDYDSGTTVLVPYPLVEPMTQLPPGAPDPQVPMTASHDGGVPPNCHVNCSFPGDQTATLAMFNKTYLACADSPGWTTVTHEKCQATTFPLPDAAGYVNPGNGLTPPEAYGSMGGAGDANGGAGESAPGAGDNGGGGL